MARDAETNWVRIDDFTPGIADRPGTNYPPGQAQPVGTWRCWASKSGALQPLFEPSTSYTGLPSSIQASDPDSGLFVVSGFFAAGPVIPIGGTQTERGHELFLGTEFCDGGNRKLYVERINVFEAAIEHETIKSVSHADANTDPNGWGMSWGMTRMTTVTTPTPDEVGIPVLMFAWSDLFTGEDGFVNIFPHTDTPTTNSTYTLVGSGAPVTSVDKQRLAICHQGRIVMREETVYDHGDNPGGGGTVTKWATTEDLYWTGVNDPTELFGPFQFVPENPDGYSVMGAMSANELFGLKQSGGVMLAGDLDEPTITNLPMVAGAGEGGVYTRLGFIYGGTTGGLWVWPHGDTSQHLSQQMNPDFYLIVPEYLLAQKYQWDCAEHFVFLSNNWVLDTDTGAYWRLEDYDLQRYRFMAHKGYFLYGAVSSYTADDRTCIYSWDMRIPATSYQWVSHPLWSTIDKRVKLREITARVSGTGTVVITVESLEGESDTCTVTSASDTPTLTRAPVSVDGTCLTVTIESEGDIAPTVLEVNLAVQDAPHTASAVS